MGLRINWEYKTLTFEAAGFWSGGGKLDAQLLTGQLNELGSEGWELVSIFDTTKCSSGKWSLLVNNQESGQL
jgi:hypothetical protein